MSYLRLLNGFFYSQKVVKATSGLVPYFGRQRNNFCQDKNGEYVMLIFRGMILISVPDEKSLQVILVTQKG